MSFVLLGAVAAEGPCTPYDIKRVVARRVGPLWEVPHSQVYEEAARLARAGLLEEHQEAGGRRRLTYRITAEGRRELLRWLRMPARERMEVRDPGLLKLAFADELTPAELANVAEDHAEAWRVVRAQLDADADAGDDAEGAASAGIAYSRAVADAAVAFWDRLGPPSAAALLDGESNGERDGKSDGGPVTGGG